MKSISIIGSNGQLGSDLVKTFLAAEWNVIPKTHSEISVENYDSVKESLCDLRTDWIINTAAIHKIDECEKNSQKAWEINVEGAKNVAKVANQLGMRTVYISSDYVFSGDKGSAYNEHDHVSPINAYGYSKAGGEAVTLSASEDNLVVRISSVFGAAGSSGKGGNFVESIIKKAKAGDPLMVVDDILMSPTYTIDASIKILELLSQDKSGIYNASNSGAITWYGFAREILTQTKLNPPITASETNLDSVPRRPKNSSLDISKVEKILTESPTWSQGLNCYLLQKGHIK